MYLTRGVMRICSKRVDSPVVGQERTVNSMSFVAHQFGGFMSAREKCTCGRKRGDHKDLVVTQRNCNYSAFNGYHYTPSDYSQVVCLRPGCNGSWRSKADYVDGLPDMDPEKAYEIRTGQLEE